MLAPLKRLSVYPPQEKSALRFPFFIGFYIKRTDTQTVCGWSFFILSVKDVRTWKIFAEQLKQEYEKTTVLLERETENAAFEKPAGVSESGSRKQRTHRLITRGAAIESIAPQTKELTETEFYSLMGKHFESAAGGATHRSAQKTTPVFSGRRKAVTKDSTLSFFNRTDKTQRRSECHCQRSLPSRGASLQQLLWRNQRLHQKGRRDRFGNHAAAPCAGNIS